MRARSTVTEREGSSRILAVTGHARSVTSERGEARVLSTRASVGAYYAPRRRFRADEPLDQLGLVEQVGAVVATLGNLLRAAQVKVHRGHAVLDVLRRLQQDLRVVARKLRDDGSVLALRVVDLGKVPQHFATVEGGGGALPRRDHRRVCQVGAVALAQHAEGRLGLVDHRCEHPPGRVEPP
eukprot:2106165-Prymnesium_polylepis.2